MAHYAQVINGLVTRVLMINDEDVEAERQAYEGELVQTSYNTRDGVHYGEDGKPDGGVALRLNYAQEGMYYDKVRDIFYRDNSIVRQGLFWLDEATMGVRPVMPNKAVQRRYDNSSNERTVYITAEGQALMGGQTKDNLEAGMNLLISQDLDKAILALPTSNEEARTFALRTEYAHCRPIGSRPLWNLTDRVLQQQLITPVMKTWAIPSEAVLRALPVLLTQHIRLIRQRTHVTESHPLNDTVWATPQTLAAQLDAAFWEGQQDTEAANGPFVVQYAMPRPYRDLTIRIAVNNNSDVHVWSVTRLAYDQDGNPLKLMPYGESVEALVNLIQADVKAQGVRAGFHTVEFVKYQGAWKLIDWKAHIDTPFLDAFASVYPILDDAFLHMLDQPLRHVQDHLYVEERSYASGHYDRSVASLVGKSGLFARWKDDKLQSAAAIGISEREVGKRFDALDQALAHRGAVS